MHTLEARVSRGALSIELAGLSDQLSAVERSWRQLTAGLSNAQLNWRPAPGRWSIGEHLAHLNLVDASYLPYLDAMIARGRSAGLLARASSKHPWLGGLIVRSTEPPVKLPVRTSAANVPPSMVDRDEALAELTEVRRALRERIADAAGLDPRRMTMRYAPGLGPARWVRLSFGQWLMVTAAHDRRHLWLAHRVPITPGFPGR